MPLRTSHVCTIQTRGRIHATLESLDRGCPRHRILQQCVRAPDSGSITAQDSMGHAMKVTFRIGVLALVTLLAGSLTASSATAADAEIERTISTGVPLL